ncbi:hypothetical protein ACVWZK_006436 [Bradyrhizobium sp. GM0.4]
MHGASAITPNSANRRGGETCTGSTSPCTITRPISDLFRALYPQKTWGVLADLLGISERAAKYKMASKRPYTTAELRALLGSEDGAEVLEILMEGSKPQWWRQLQKEIALCRARAHQERARQEVMKLDQEPLEVRSRRQVKRFSDADRRLHANLAEQETAVGLLRADGNRPVHRAMAQAKGSRR